MTFTQNQLPTFVKQPQNGKATSNNTTNTNIYAGGTNGTKVISLIATTNSAAAVVVNIQILNGSTLYNIGQANVAAGSGTTAANATINLLSPTYIPGLPFDADGNPYLILISGDSLQITLGAAIASPNVCTVFAVAGDF